MLFRKDFCRGHERDVEAAFQRHQRRAGGHGGFARTDIALQQPPHRMRAAHVLADFAQHLRLRTGKLETEPGKKRFDEAVVAAARQRRCVRFKIFPPGPDLNLQFNELVQRQPSPCNFDVGQFLREMRHVDGVGA